MVRVGLKDTFGESGRPQELLEKYGLTKGDLIKAVHEVLAKKLA
jgi:transketolase